MSPYVPKLLDRTLGVLHSVHQGIEKMQAKAQVAVYWPGIDIDITNYVKRCLLCTRCKATQQVQSMLPHGIPDGLWQEITANYVTHKSKDYLIICNLFSKYPFLYKTTTKSGLAMQFGPHQGEFTLTMDCPSL